MRICQHSLDNSEKEAGINYQRECLDRLSEVVRLLTLRY